MRWVPLLLALLLAACSTTPRHDQEIVPAVAPSAPADDPADFMSRLARI